mmetsp:Transcript_24600/g.73850  ORF Transcript_24600/g.73850 Transcript_24600/m.73850 type:complete len:236 (-) Transcript_24600:170-877(-)
MLLRAGPGAHVVPAVAVVVLDDLRVHRGRRGAPELRAAGLGPAPGHLGAVDARAARPHAGVRRLLPLHAHDLRLAAVRRRLLVRGLRREAERVARELGGDVRRDRADGGRGPGPLLVLFRLHVHRAVVSRRGPRAGPGPGRRRVRRRRRRRGRRGLALAGFGRLRGPGGLLRYICGGRAGRVAAGGREVAGQARVETRQPRGVRRLRHPPGLSERVHLRVARGSADALRRRPHVA